MAGPTKIINCSVTKLTTFSFALLLQTSSFEASEAIVPFRPTRNWSTDSDSGTKTKHNLELRNWGLRNREGLRGSKKTKKFEPLKKHVDFLSLSGGVPPSRLLSQNRILPWGGECSGGGFPPWTLVSPAILVSEITLKVNSGWNELTHRDAMLWATPSLSQW